MATQVINDDRLTVLNDKDVGSGEYVLYWMQRAQRAEHNDALEHAIRQANDLSGGLLVVFGLTADYPDASRRHYRFMLEGLRETVGALQRRGIGVAIRQGTPPTVAAAAAADAALLVTDRAYQRHLVRWRQQVADDVDVRVEQVEADVIVPVDVVSDKREYAARTIRPKLHDHLDAYLQELRPTSLDVGSDHLGGDGLDLSDLDTLLDDLGVDDRVGEVDWLTGGTSQAKSHLARFITSGLAGYGDRDPDPLDPAVSYLSAYLHYGQISPVAVARAIGDSQQGSTADRTAFIEELLVRRELAVNYVHNEPDYDRYSALPDWARTTLAAHTDDPRQDIYTAAELEAGQTHDPAWNAAMTQMREAGYLHNHLRMYWAKQVLRWTNTPEHAFRTLLDLNNRYFLDGRDCSSYANVAWAFGLHDQAFAEREVTGKTRPMTLGGLKRKFDVDAYIAAVDDQADDS